MLPPHLARLGEHAGEPKPSRIESDHTQLVGAASDLQSRRMRLCHSAPEGQAGMWCFNDLFTIHKSVLRPGDFAARSCTCRRDGLASAHLVFVQLIDSAEPGEIRSFRRSQEGPT